MRVVFLFASILMVAVSLGAAPARAQDGLKAGDEVPFAAGAPFSVDKVAIRSDARKIVDFLDRYADAPSPKALAMSEDGLNVYGFWEREDRSPRTASDVRRMALQHCEFVSGTACALVAVDGQMAAGQPNPVEALPKSGRFEPARMPFWSTASIAQAEGLGKYASIKSAKALAIAPASGARIAVGRGDTIEEARASALDQCAKRVGRDGVRCVVFVENDEVVYGQPDGTRQLVTGRNEAPRQITVVYVGAWNCAPCGGWEATRRRPFLESALAGSVVFREVKAGTYVDTRNTAKWPDDIQWIRDRNAANAGTPRFIVVADRRIVLNTRGAGNWDKEVVPALQRLVALKAKAG